MYPKLATCKFAARSIEFLGLIIFILARNRPLWYLLNQKASFQWTAAHSSPVQAFKGRLIHCTKLSSPDLTKPFVLRTAASGVTIGAVVEQDGKPLVFLSKRLSDAEMRYSTSVFRPKCFVVSSLPPTAPQQPRNSASNPPEAAVPASLLLVQVKVGRGPRLQTESNTNSGPFHESLSPLLHENVQASPQSSVSDTEMQVSGSAFRISITTFLQPAIWASPRHTNQIAMKFYWKGIREYVRAYVETCPRCRAFKAICQEPAGLLQTSNIPFRTWSSMSLDCIEGSFLSGEGYDTILTVVDSLSKMAHFIPTKGPLSTADFVRLFADCLARYHGLPTTMPRTETRVLFLSFGGFSVGSLALSVLCPALSTPRQTVKRTRGCPKFQHRHIGPYCILERIGKAAYKLQLPSSMPIHPVFHVSLLSAHRRMPQKMTSPPEWEPIGKASDGLPIHEVENILEQEGEGDAARYLVKWKAFPDSDATWEPKQP
ncbi:hypothetical protein Esti_005394 [Eimeria stiedai]